jgi:hypothetical protein
MPNAYDYGPGFGPSDCPPDAPEEEFDDPDPHSRMREDDDVADGTEDAAPPNGNAGGYWTRRIIIGEADPRFATCVCRTCRTLFPDGGAALDHMSATGHVELYLADARDRGVAVGPVRRICADDELVADGHDVFDHFALEWRPSPPAWSHWSSRAALDDFAVFAGSAFDNGRYVEAERLRAALGFYRTPDAELRRERERAYIAVRNYLEWEVEVPYLVACCAAWTIAMMDHYRSEDWRHA